MREVVLVAGDGLVEVFAVGEAAEVEGGAPPVFVDVGGEVVIAMQNSACCPRKSSWSNSERGEKRTDESE